MLTLLSVNIMLHLLSLLDKHAPLKRIYVDWITDKILILKLFDLKMVIDMFSVSGRKTFSKSKSGIL